jgi:protein tyrosine/serine phosphatase
MIRVLFLAILLTACGTARQPIIETEIQSVSESSITNFHDFGDGLYRSGRLTPENIQLLSTKYGVKTIISLETYIFGNEVKEKEMKMAKKLSIKFINVPTYSIGELDKKKLAKVLDYLKNEQKPILLHCLQGSDRTGIAVGTYRMLVNGWTYKDTIAEMDKYGIKSIYNGWKKDMKKWVEKQ